MDKDEKRENKRKYPRVVVGVLVFNDKGELFLMKSPKWHDRYQCPGGRVEAGEKLIDAARREVKEEAGLDIKDVEFIGVGDGYDVGKSYTQADDHLVFIDYKAVTDGKAKVKLNREGTGYKWRKPQDWLASDKLGKYVRMAIENNIIGKQESDIELKYKRALADYQNLTKRTAQEKMEFAKYANEQLLYEILPVYDNLKLALKHAGDTENSVNIKEGVEHIIKQFGSVLKDAGVEEIGTVGEKFDPASMEAIEGKGETVKKEVKPGYSMHGKVIIPAKVIVG